MTTITIFSLSTCGNCKSVKTWLKKKGFTYQAIEVDLLNSDDRLNILKELKKRNPLGTFPTTLVDDTVILGNRPQKILEALPQGSKSNLWQRIRQYFKFLKTR